MCTKNDLSPCIRCTRVVDPDACENKNCKLWKTWFLRRWAAIYRYGQRHGALQKGRVHNEMEK